MGKTKVKTIDDSAKEIEKLGGAAGASQESTAVLNLSKDEDAPEIPKRQDPISKEKKSKRAQKKAISQPKVRGKKYQQMIGKVNSAKRYPLPEAIKLVQETSYSKFPGTVEIHINTNAKNIRGLVTLPFMVGKKLSILAFGPSTSSGSNDLKGVIWGDDQTIADIENGKVKFDIVVTTPEWMPKLAKVAKILGPKGLMPNPKSGTITDNLIKTVAELQGGKTEYKTESNGQVIHIGIGKVNQEAEEIAANVKALLNTIGKSKVSKITLSSSMGPGVKVDLSSI